jgi:hypothetical protein
MREKSKKERRKTKIQEGDSRNSGVNSRNQDKRSPR